MNLESKQISEHIHALKIPFKLDFGGGRLIDRFVYAYLVYGKQIWVIDSGVAGSTEAILNYVKATGRKPEEINMLIFTHSHPDHIGGALKLQSATGCRIAAHVDDISWIEDIELQNRERPIPRFDSLVEGALKVDHTLKDNEALDLGDGVTMKVIHTPGHSKGHISIWCETDKALISADAIPVAKTLLIYDDVPDSINSITRLKDIRDIEILLSSWDEPRYGEEVSKIMDSGIDYIKEIHREIIKVKNETASNNVEIVARALCQKMGFPMLFLMPLFYRTIDAHLRVDNSINL